jgi:anti-sigma regulatory factor (Ser/Thr protein kinase)
MAPFSRIHSLELGSQLSEVARASAWVRGHAERLGLSRSLAYRLDLSLSEMLTNLLTHGLEAIAPQGRPLGLQVRLVQENGNILLQIHDDGLPFDPLQYCPASAPASLEEAVIGGHGIRLMRDAVDGCIYRRDGGANLLEMRFCERESKDGSHEPPIGPS